MTSLAIRTIALATMAVAASAAIAAEPERSGDPATGRRFALQTCALCHVVASGQLAPKRFATAPSFNTIANMNSTTASSLHAYLSTPHPIMPNLILTRQEQRDVITYILSLKR